MTTPRTGAKAEAVGQYIYVIGGGRTTPGPETVHRSVEYSPIRSDGSLGEWELASPLNTPRIFHATAQADGVIYVLGGEYFPEGNMRLLNSVEYAKVGADGRLGPWIETSVMLTPRRSSTATVANGYLYAIGGYNGTLLRTVERAPISKEGELGPWERVSQLLTAERYIHGGVFASGRLYVIGGHKKETGSGSSAAEWTTVGSDGTLQPWRETSALTRPRFLAGTVEVEGFLFMIGGYDGQYLRSVEHARIQTDGNLSLWNPAASLTTPRGGAAVVAVKNALYVIGGSNKRDYLRSVERAQLNKDGGLGHFKNVSD